jgi:hypothetical protein
LTTTPDVLPRVTAATDEEIQEEAGWVC